MTVSADSTAVEAKLRGASLFQKRRRNALRVSRSMLWCAGVFTAWFAFYCVVGYRIVVREHVVPFDALARLSHAYFVWWNAPPKLAAVGFVWPPLSTLVFLPAAGLRPVATSLVALPLTTAFFAALLLTLLDRVLALARMDWRLRVPLLGAFGMNPMIVFYAINGMSEVVYLFFLTVGVYFFLRWFLVRESRFLVLTAVAFAFGVLSRYEVFGWAAVVAGAIVVALMRQRVSRSEIEGSVIAYLAPVVYALGLWLFVNWLILGHPLYFLSQQAPGFAQTTPTSAPPPPAQVTTRIPARTVLADLISLNWHLFPMTIVIVLALVTLFFVRRDLMAIMLAGFIGLNAFFTGVLIWTSGNAGLLQLRYNMRAMPLAFVGVAWIFLGLQNRSARAVAWVASLVLLIGSAASSWHAMQTYRFQFMEQAFTRAVATGHDQEGSRSIGGYLVGTEPERRMARWISGHVHRRDAILTDDAQSFAVMLFTGHPERFYDRIDRGDTKWLATLDAPFGHVHYLLASRVATNDLARFRYPRLFEGRERGFTLAYEDAHFGIFRVARVPPADRQRGPR